MDAKAEANKQRTETSSAGSQRGRTRAARGINVGMRYVEDKDGNTIDGTRASAMRKAARLIWVHISLNNPGGPPPTWGKADVTMVQAYRSEMCRQFPELRLCESNWKADQIATDYYPSWYSGQSENQSRVNVAMHTGVQSTNTVPGMTTSNLKRNAKELRKPGAKRPKVDGTFMASKADLSIRKVECNPHSYGPS
jgi:hypothetical protein